MERYADVVIIGGGVIGCSIAYHLAKRGCTDVVLLERNTLGSGSTERSAGGVRQQFSTPVNVLMGIYNVRAFETMAEELGCELVFNQYGYLFLLTRKEELEDFRASVEMQRRLGVKDVELLTPEEVGRRFPYVNTEDLVGASFCPTDGYTDPHEAVQCYARQARRLGARLYEGIDATGITVVNGRVEGVKTPEGPIATRWVVNAAGPWARAVGLMAGVDVPVEPVRHQIFFTEPFPEIPEPIPLTIDFSTGFYFRKEGPGLLMGMEDPDEEPGFKLEVNWAQLERLVEAAVHRAPILDRARIRSAWAGLYEVSPDHNAILGTVPDVEGFLCANGFSGHGFQMAPSVGLVISEIILDGRAHTFDISELGIERFRTGRLVRETRVV
jgi:sarcosine oxidase subunit beta